MNNKQKKLPKRERNFAKDARKLLKGQSIDYNGKQLIADPWFDNTHPCYNCPLYLNCDDELGSLCATVEILSHIRYRLIYANANETT